MERNVCEGKKKQSMREKRQSHLDEDVQRFGFVEANVFGQERNFKITA